jgi:PAS domain S-box-containing protein
MRKKPEPGYGQKPTLQTLRDKDWLKASGELADLIREMDWSATPLGSRNAWRQSLRTVVNLVLASSFPMAILWGSELILIYNDGYRIIAGGKHPQALGHSTRDIWSEVWEFNKPIFEKVMTRGETVYLENQLLHISRHGYMEDAYFILSYSPILTEEGTVGGALVTLMETTQAAQDTLKLLEAVQEEKDRLASLIGSISDEVWFADTEKRFTLANPSALREFGINANEQIEVEKLALALEVYSPDGTPRAVEEAPPLRALRGEVVMNQVETIRTPATGELRHRQVSSTPVRNSAGAIIGSVSVVRDITALKQAEAALRESERLYRAIGESIDFGIWVCAPDGRNIYASDSFLKLVGLTQEQCSNFGWGDVLHPEDAERTIAAWKECVRTEGTWDIEHRFRDADGGWHPILARGVPVRDENGRIKCWAGINLDISKQKQAEESVRKANDELELRIQERTAELTEALQTLGQAGAYTRNLIETSLDPLVTIGRDGKITDVNAATETITGLARQELLGTDFSIYFTNPEKASVGYKQVFKEGSVRDYPLEIRHRDGHTIPVLYHAALYRDKAGEVVGIFAAARDITERKRTEEALRQSEQEFRTLAEAVPQIVWATRPDGWNIYFNQKWMDYTGLTLEQSYGHGWIIPFHPDDQQRAWEAWKHATLDGAVYSLECRLRRADGIYRWWLIRGEPMRDARGEILKWFGTCTDIEDLKQTSEQLRRVASELLVAEQRERQRLAQVLHDGLQQILVGAKYRLVLLERSQDVNQTKDQVVELIDDAIETSRSLSLELSPPILLQKDLVSALEWLVRWMHDKHGIEVSLTASAKIAHLKEDTILLLFQAARELLLNAVKHAGVKNAYIEVNQRDDHISMTVADKGVGFDQNILTLRGGQSSGTGLFGINERLSYIGGRIEIDSAPGAGSRFRLIVPISEANTEVGQGAAEDTARVSFAISPQIDSKPAGVEKKIRIALVDDHIVLRQGLGGLLRCEPDFTIVGEASDGQSAIDLVRELKPDVVLMDISMPGMDGIQATQIIHKELPRIRIIGLSMFQEGEQQAAMREAGAVNYLTKSGPSETLIEAIRASVRVSEQIEFD